MEEVTLLPVVDITMVADSNGGDVVPCENVTTSVRVEETKEKINVDAAANGEAADEINGSSTRIGRSASSRPARRKRGFGLFRAVYQLSFSLKKAGAGSPKKKAGAGDDVPPATVASWKSIVDGMRPLRLPGQKLEYYPPPPPPGHVDVYHDVLLAPPSSSPMRASYERGMTSRYASAQDLHLLDCGDQEADEEATLAADGGNCPQVIDMQAEEFIAKFYEQFNLQKSESLNGRAKE